MEVKPAQAQLNAAFGSRKINFWAMLFSFEEIKPNPEKIKALEDLQPYKNKEEFKLFICMMQSNSNSILYFLKSVAPFSLFHTKITETVTESLHQDHSLGLMVKVLDSQSRGPVFKTTGWLQG